MLVIWTHVWANRTGIVVILNPLLKASKNLHNLRVGGIPHDSTNWEYQVEVLLFIHYQCN